MGKQSQMTNYYTSPKQEIACLLSSSVNRKRRQVKSRPLPQSIRASKSTTTYNAHSYPTKIPPEAIATFIDHYTKDHDVILDPFCGSGMTGLGVRLLAASHGQGRKVILNDLGTAATHIAFNYNHSVELNEFNTVYTHIVHKLKEQMGQLYLTFHPIKKNTPIDKISLAKIEKQLPKESNGVITIKYSGKSYKLLRAEIVAVMWSEVNRCTYCGSNINLWQTAMNFQTGKMAKEFKCPRCKTKHMRKDFKKPLKSEMSYLIYEYRCPMTNKIKRAQRKIGLFDSDIYKRIEKKRIRTWYPQQKIDPKREMMTMGPAKLGIKKVSDFYTKRNLIICSKIWNEIEKVQSQRVRAALKFAATNTFWHATKMRRFNTRGGMRPLTGTLYVPQISAECNVFKVLSKKINELNRFYSSNLFSSNLSQSTIQICHLNKSATNLKDIPSNSIDYIFTDPPFGGNIFYSDCSIIWDGWLNKLTDDKNEIIFNRSRKPKDGGKTKEDYHSLMDLAFMEMFRVLKEGRWASIVFNNSDNEILSGFLNSAAKAGFIIEEVTFLDKNQKSVKGYMGKQGIQNVTNLDIILTVKKHKNKIVQFSKEKKRVTEKFIYQQICQYLCELPKNILKNGNLFTEEHRTTPFLHSMLLRKFIKKNINLKELTIDRIISICTQGDLVYKKGHWYLKRKRR